MERLDHSLVTPIYVKTSDNAPWPEDKVFYLLTADHLYLCRNHAFFRSCVPAPRWPTELADQATLLRIRYPRIPRLLLEDVCGFFDYVWRRDAAEAIALLAWDPDRQSVCAVIPEQVASVRRNSWGERYPLSVKYKAPADLGNLQVFCDIHSHCDMAAYASPLDMADEQTRTGLHLVVGRLQDEPPQFHLEAVVDGTRFLVKQHAIIEGYHRRRQEFPPEWLDRVTAMDEASYENFRFDDPSTVQHGEFDAEGDQPDAPASPSTDTPANECDSSHEKRIDDQDTRNEQEND